MTHGYTGPVVRWLQEKGVAARAVQTRFEGERDDEAAEDTGPLGSGEAAQTQLLQL